MNTQFLFIGEKERSKFLIRVRFNKVVTRNLKSVKFKTQFNVTQIELNQSLNFNPVIVYSIYNRLDDKKKIMTLIQIKIAYSLFFLPGYT